MRIDKENERELREERQRERQRVDGAERDI